MSGKIFSVYKDGVLEAEYSSVKMTANHIGVRDIYSVYKYINGKGTNRNGYEIVVSYTSDIDLPGEVWKPINWIESINPDYYMVSNKGRVKSINRIVKRADGVECCMKSVILSQRISRGLLDGYFITTLSCNGISFTKFVHKLVADAFIPNPEHKEMVNHKDGNMKNNCVENLEWATTSENNLHAYKTGLNPNNKYEIWKPIDWIPNLSGYEVSNFGNVRSVDRFIDYKGNKILKKGKMLSQTQVREYLEVNMSDELGNSRTYKVHSLVARAFVPNPNNLSSIEHKDLNKLNNLAINLEWSHRNNFSHSIRDANKKTILIKSKERLEFDSRKSAAEFLKVTPAMLYKSFLSGTQLRGYTVVLFGYGINEFEMEERK